MQESQETQVPSVGWEDPLEEFMATHSRILAWRILRTEETELQSITKCWMDLLLSLTNQISDSQERNHGRE